MAPVQKEYEWVSFCKHLVLNKFRHDMQVNFLVWTRGKKSTASFQVINWSSWVLLSMVSARQRLSKLFLLSPTLEDWNLKQRFGVCHKISTRSMFVIVLCSYIDSEAPRPVNKYGLQFGSCCFIFVHLNGLCARSHSLPDTLEFTHAHTFTLTSRWQTLPLLDVECTCRCSENGETKRES